MHNETKFHAHFRINGFRKLSRIVLVTETSFECRSLFNNDCGCRKVTAQRSKPDAFKSYFPNTNAFSTGAQCRAPEVYPRNVKNNVFGIFL